MKLSFGINDRSSSRPGARSAADRSRRSTSNTNVFHQDDDDDDDDDDHDRTGEGDVGSSSRSRVNRELLREQEALRRRAERDNRLLGPLSEGIGDEQQEAPGAGASSSSLYDYDGSYESFKPSKAPPPPPSSKSEGPKTSKYVGDLLRAAEQRQKEREIRIERKVAKEQQAEEEAEGDGSLAGKDKFVTAAYKRKLQERELWQREQIAKEAQEQKADVTLQRNASLAMSSFYSNLNRNVAMGGGGDGGGDGSNGADSTKCKDSMDRSKRPKTGDEEDFDLNGGSFLDGFEKRPLGSHEDDGGEAGAGASVEPPAGETDPSLERRRVRQQKLEQARARYFQRHPDRRKEAAAS